MDTSKFVQYRRIMTLRKPLSAPDGEKGWTYETRSEAYADRERFEPLLAFNDRESYIAWRADWRIEIKTLAETQTKLKEFLSDSKAGSETDIRSNAQSRIALNAQEITFLIALRKHSKTKAEEQFLAAKVTVS